MKATIFGAALLLLSHVLTARPTDSLRTVRSPHFVLKFAPLSLPDNDPTLQGALEVRLTKRISWQGEFGYGWPELSLMGRYFLRNHNFAERKIWRFRTEGRYYFPASNPFFKSASPAMSGVYLAGEYLYKQINVSIARFLPTTGSGTAPVISVPIGRFVWALHAKAGFQTPLSRNPRSAASRLLLDVYGGMGIRHTHVRQLAYRDVIAVRGEGTAFSRFSPGRAFRSGSLSGGIKIGWGL